MHFACILCFACYKLHYILYHFIGTSFLFFLVPAKTPTTPEFIGAVWCIYKDSMLGPGPRNGYKEEKKWKYKIQIIKKKTSPMESHQFLDHLFACYKILFNSLYKFYWFHWRNLCFRGKGKDPRKNIFAH